MSSKSPILYSNVGVLAGRNGNQQRTLTRAQEFSATTIA